MTQDNLNASFAATRDANATATASTTAAGNAFSPATASDGTAAEPLYRLVIEESVVEKIAALAAQKIDGIIDMKGSVFSRIQEGLGGEAKTKGVDADVIDEHSARVDLSVILEYGKSAPQVFDEIKGVVASDLRSMTGLAMTEMTVNVVDVMTPEEYSRKRNASSDGGQTDGSSS